MFTDGLKETTQDIICMNGVTAKAIRNIIDFAYSSSMDLDLGRINIQLLYMYRKLNINSVECVFVLVYTVASYKPTPSAVKKWDCEKGGQYCCCKK
jgi:hypothetical protein